MIKVIVADKDGAAPLLNTGRSTAQLQVTVARL